VQAVRRTLGVLVAVVVMIGVAGEGTASARGHQQVGGHQHAGRHPARGHGYAVAQLAQGGLADPAPLRAQGRLHLFGTGPGFPVLVSKGHGRGFRRVATSMPRSGRPRWFGTGVGGDRHLWAPHVERVRGRRGSVYLMYFTATRRGGWDCIGVARSAHPARGYHAVGGPLVCGGGRATMIDPSVYVGPHGRRWLTWVRHDRVTGVGEVRILALARFGLHVRPGARSRRLVANGRTITEAPSMLTYGGATWLFVSRYSYRGCGYRTEVYRSRTPGGRFTPAGPDHGPSPPPPRSRPRRCPTRSPAATCSAAAAPAPARPTPSCSRWSPASPPRAARRAGSRAR
jgi:hypothetical protein